MELLKHEKEHIDTIRRYGAECTVLLKKNGRFPINGPCRVALYGSGARKTLKGGTGSGDVYSRFYITAEEGLERAGFTVTTKDWLDTYDEFSAARHREFARKLRLKIKKAGHEGMQLYGTGAIDAECEYEFPTDHDGDICVYVLSRLSGEGTDREAKKGDILLTDGEVRDILKLNEKFERFILVLNVSGVVDLSPVKNVGNILLLSQLGIPTGDILADIILGKCDPSGRLTTTWTAFSDYQTIGEFGERDDTRYNEGIYVGYRYFDTVGAVPMFPFGYGLSYSEFNMNFGEISNDGGKITVTANVTNIGKYSGREVVQAYLSCPWGRFDKPARELCAYGKTKLLSPGESETVSLTFDLTSHTTYDTENAAFILESGEYLVYIGKNSRDLTLAAKIVLDGDATVRKVKNLTADVDFDDFVPARPERGSTAGLPAVHLSASDFAVDVVSYGRGGKYDRIEDFVKTLTDEELIYLCIGHICRDKNDPGLSVFGAVGETTKLLGDKLRKTLVCSDGPAGLRLTKEIILAKDEPFGVFEHELDWLVEVQPYEARRKMQRHLARRPRGERIYQYTTAIPIATAIAQSWNPLLAETMGDFVGEELEMFGINIWLAPALNIHRSILCGRNFEYYSEDPLISGETAAAVTRGVMRHKGCTTTIKHYCCNNQEFNRFGSNSVVSERAMREVYMRGFEIAVRTSGTKCVMTTYNLLNGLHTCENKELCYDVLRAEWGFDGVVMTDWAWTGGNDIGNKYRGFLCSKILAADNDLMMPGRMSDVDDAKAALESGELTREQLEINGSRIFRLINDLDGTEKEWLVNDGKDYMNDRES